MVNELELKIIDNIIDEKALSEEAVSLCKLSLEKWCRQDQDGFIERLGADLETVLKKYRFDYVFYSLNKNQLVGEPLYYIEITIRIYDEENSFILEYNVSFDDKLKIFNENFRRWLYSGW